MPVSSQEMAVIDKNAKYFGKSVNELMEEAGKKVASFIDFGDSCSVFCGKGNNGGDGFVVARYLDKKGYDVIVYLIGESDEIKSKAARENWRKLKDLDVSLVEETDVNFYRGLDIETDVVVDAILGLGIKGKLREPIKSTVKTINNTKKPVISVDVPTGIDPDTGNGNGIKPNKTITFHKKKKGIKKSEVVDIGIPKKAETHAGPGDLLYLKKRDPLSHKGQNGKTLIIGGGKYTGAPALSALAALRTGTDLAVIHTKEKNREIIAGFSPNLIVKTHKNYKKSINELIQKTKNYDTVLIGPGIGRKEKDIEAMTKLIQKTKSPTILDADALYASTKKPEIIKNKIITPHEGEFKRLFNKKGKKENVEKIAKKFNCIIVKKGHKDIISNGEKTKINESGTPAMTVGGTGDILSGAIAASIATNQQKKFEATVATTFLIGKAGEYCEKEFGDGLIATDLLKKIPKVKKRYNE